MSARTRKFVGQTVTLDAAVIIVAVGGAGLSSAEFASVGFLFVSQVPADSGSSVVVITPPPMVVSFRAPFVYASEPRMND